MKKLLSPLHHKITNILRKLKTFSNFQRFTTRKKAVSFSQPKSKFAKKVHNETKKKTHSF